MAESEPIVTEILGNGLVIGKDPSILKPGELSECINAIYKPNSLSLFRAPGRSLFGTVTAGQSVYGLVDIKYDNGNSYLIAEVSGSRYRAPVGNSGTWVTAATGLASGKTLDVVQYSNRYFLMNGGAQNQVAYLSATAVANTPVFRNMGMQPVTVVPTGVTAAGTWSQTITGNFEYWTTEVAEIVQDGATAILESTYGADPFNPSAFKVDPLTIQVTSTSQSVTLFRPFPTASTISAFNPTSTRWRVYRSAQKTNATDVAFPFGFQIADLPLSTSSFTDGVSVTATANCVSATALSAWTPSSGTLSQCVTSSDNTYARITGVGGGIMKVFGFNWSTTPTDPIAGIQVSVEAKSNAAIRTLSLGLTNDGGTTSTPTKTVALTNSDIVYTVGTSNDLWGFTWSAATLTASANFGVMAYGTIHNNGGGQTIDIDQIRATAYYNGTPSSSNDAFPAVVIDVGGEQTAVGANGPPPISSTGDIYEDCMVVNDVNFPSLVRWSLAGQPEYFPWLYFEDIETQQNDIVTNIKALPTCLIIGLRNSLYRMNYLPTAQDANFSRGKAIEEVSTDHGIVNPKAACFFTNTNFSYVGRRELCFIAADGIFVTDGFTIREAAPDIRWSDIFDGIDRTNPANLFLENDPSNWEIKVCISTSAGNVIYRLHYHPEHIKYTSDLYGRGSANMKISGPHNVYHYDDNSTANVRCMRTVVRSTGSTSTYYGYYGVANTGGGAVYRETGTNVPVTNNSGTNLASVRTRRMYLAGIGNDFTLNDIYVHAQASPAVLQFYVDTDFTNTGEGLDSVPKIVTPSFIGNSKISPMVNAEAIRIRFTDDSGSPLTINDWTLDQLTLAGVNFARELF
jgi:hypothetical protein